MEIKERQFQSRIRYAVIREVKAPTRANDGDAGLDFYIPTNLKFSDLAHANSEANDISIRDWPFDDVVPESYVTRSENGAAAVFLKTNKNGIVEKITLEPNARVLIPSGICCLIEPKESMLMAANKSGICSKQGLIYGAEIIDSPYVGEIHISIINTSRSFQDIDLTKKIIQFIHVPIFDTQPEKIDIDTFGELSKNWGNRGSKGFGSSDKDKDNQGYIPELNDII